MLMLNERRDSEDRNKEGKNKKNERSLQIKIKK
jgi:hypothetical protein